MRTIRWRALPYALLAIASLQVASAQAAGSGATDAAALLALKGAATNAKFNTWTGEAPCGAKPWQYITCDKDRVVGLELGGKGIQGTLPPELATMDQLQLLSLGGNSFSGGLPSAWGAATAFPLLVSMDINGSSLTGALPPSWGAAGAFPVLQTLMLDGNKLSGSLPQTWGGDSALPLMTTLSVRNNTLSGSLPPTWCNDAASLPAIQTLQLDGNVLSGTLPGYWGGRGCQQMRSMDLHSNKLSGALPTYWGSQGYWPNLQTMRLDSNALSGGFPAEWTSRTAFPAMRGSNTGIVVQPGNAKLSGTVPFIQFRILSISANGSTTAIANLKDPVLSKAPPPQALRPPPSTANSTASQPATVSATVGLTGTGLWPFTALQQAAFKSVVLAGLGSGNPAANITEAQLTIGAAKLSTASVSQYVSIKEKGRRLLQDTQSVEVPVYVLTTVGKAPTVEAALTALANSSALQTELKAAGFQLNDVTLAGISSAQGDNVPSPAENMAQAVAPAQAPVQDSIAGSGNGGGSGGPNVAAIVGGVVGGVIGFVLLGALVWAWIKKRRQDRQSQFITHRTIVKPGVRQASITSVTLPYRKSTLATVQESHSGEWSAALDAIGQPPPDSPGGSSRGGRLTQGLYRTHSSGSAEGNLVSGLYRTHSSGSGEANLLDHTRTGGVHSSNFVEQLPVYVVPMAGTQQAGSPNGSGTPLTQSALGTHTRFTNPEDNNASWTTRFSRTFARQ